MDVYTANSQPLPHRPIEPDEFQTRYSQCDEIRLLAPGAVQVSDISWAYLIQDPGINFVLVDRPTWTSTEGEQIRHHLPVLLREHNQLEFDWYGPGAGFGRISRNFNQVFPPQPAAPQLEGARSAILADIKAQYQLMRALSGASILRVNLRIEHGEKDSAVERHIDLEQLTCVCVYEGLGTKVFPQGGEMIQLQFGQWGISKGTFRSRDIIINQQQGLEHEADATQYPRVVSICDVQDGDPAPGLRNALVPWG